MLPRASLSLVAVLALGCSPTTTTTTCPEPAPEPTRVPDTSPSTPSAPTPAPSPTARVAIRPAADFPIASNCEAPLAITEEVTRLLTAAAAHGTRSAACVDGPGQRIAINDILVCPGPSDGQALTVQAFYQVVTYPEGDTRGCNDGRDCSWLEPSASEHLIELRFIRGKAPKRGTLAPPSEPLPGFPDDSTPLGKAHDGNCYGSSEAWQAKAIDLGR